MKQLILNLLNDKWDRQVKDIKREFFCPICKKSLWALFHIDDKGDFDSATHFCFYCDYHWQIRRL